MRFFPRLLQRVFMYAFLLIIASHMVSFIIFHSGIIESMHKQVVEELATSGAESLEGKDKGAAEILSQFFHTSHRSLWVEGADGKVIAGEVKPDFSYAERASFPSVGASRKNVHLLATGNADAPYLATIPINLLNVKATLCLYMETMPPPPMSAIFLQGLIAVCLIGGALSIWVAWRIARPLRRLRSEVLEIAGGNLSARVSVKGSEEIAQVAEAVNSMAQNLSQNIAGMKELVANISHEMRSPLARMSFSSTIVEEGLHALAYWYGKKPPAEADEALPVIMDPSGKPLAVRHVGRLAQEIEHMESLIGSCLLSSKLDLQQEKPQMASLDISGLCRDVAAKYEPLFHEKSLSFRHEIQDNLWLDGDEPLLSLVLTNLLDNAVKYTREDGIVRLRLCEEREAVFLSIENSHSAIEEDDLPRLFEPFFKGVDSAESAKGVGLGLSLVKKIVVCHQGDISVKNGELGLLFTVSLPEKQSSNPEFVQWFFERHGKLASW